MSPHPQTEHTIMLSVDAQTDAEIVHAFETLSRVASSLALEGADIRIQHFTTQILCEECEDHYMEEDQ